MNKPNRRLKRPLIKYLTLPLLMGALALSGHAHAEGYCGIGKVLEVKEGGWNTNDLMIKIDYSGGDAVATNHGGYVRFRASLDPDRLNAIRAVALLAMALDKSVVTYTHDDASNGCTNADELTIVR